MPLIASVIGAIAAPLALLALAGFWVFMRTVTKSPPRTCPHCGHRAHSAVAYTVCQRCGRSKV